MIILFNILIPIFSFLTGFEKAVNDLSEEGKLKGNPLYWWKSKSSIRKYKNGDKAQGEDFKFSTTILVMFTDGWHLFQYLYNRTNKLLGVSIGVLAALYSWYYLFWFIGSSIIYQGTFHIFYTTKILKQ